MLENMDSVVRRVSVQSLKETEQNSSQFSNYEELENQVKLQVNNNLLTLSFLMFSFIETDIGIKDYSFEFGQ